MSSEGTSSTTKLKDTKPQPKLDYRSMVSVDDKPGLFVSVDSKYIFLYKILLFLELMMIYF